MLDAQMSRGPTAGPARIACSGRTLSCVHAGALGASETPRDAAMAEAAEEAGVPRSVSSSGLRSVRWHLLLWRLLLWRHVRHPEIRQISPRRAVRLTPALAHLMMNYYDLLC